MSLPERCTLASAARVTLRRDRTDGVPLCSGASRPAWLDELLVACPGSREFAPADRVTAVPFVELVG